MLEERDVWGYGDFDIRIEPNGDRYTTLAWSTFGFEAREDFSPPFSTEEIESFFLRAGLFRPLIRSRKRAEVNSVKRFGERLFSALFAGGVGECFRASLAEAHRQDKGLRVRLRLTDAPGLTSIPWEFLYDPSRRQFIAQADRTPLLRYLDIPEAYNPICVQGPIRVLVMAANPRDGELPRLDAAGETEKLRAALSVLGDGQVSLDVLEHPTLPALQRQLRRHRDVYHVFHFIGHGSFDPGENEGVLVLEDENGHPSEVYADEIGALLYNAPSLRLAVLNACEGARPDVTDPFAGTAQTLVRKGIPAVVAMQFQITDEASIAFSSEFYGALADGLPVEAAISQVRLALSTRGFGAEWGTPVLFMRSPQGHLFERGSTSAGSASPTDELPSSTAAATPAAAEPAPPPAVRPAGPGPESKSVPEPGSVQSEKVVPHPSAEDTRAPRPLPTALAPVDTEVTRVTIGFRIFDYRLRLYLATAEISPSVDTPGCLGLTLVFHSLEGIDPTAEKDPTPECPVDFGDALARDCSLSVPLQFQQIAAQLAELSNDELRSRLPEAWISMVTQPWVATGRSRGAGTKTEPTPSADEVTGMAVGFHTFEADGALYLAEAEISPYLDHPTALGVTLVFHSLGRIDPTEDDLGDVKPVELDFDDQLTRDENASALEQTHTILWQLSRLTRAELREYLRAAREKRGDAPGHGSLPGDSSAALRDTSLPKVVLNPPSSTAGAHTQSADRVGASPDSRAAAVIGPSASQVLQRLMFRRDRPQDDIVGSGCVDLKCSVGFSITRSQRSQRSWFR
jgi:hypothetical protein